MYVCNYNLDIATSLTRSTSSTDPRMNTYFPYFDEVSGLLHLTNGFSDT